MKRIMKTIAVCLAALLCGCSITGHLERRQYCADVLHVSREQREREQQTYQPPALKIEWDSNRFYLVPTEVQENGERIMAMQIQQVTIRAKARTLPERLGKVIIDFVIDMPRQLQGACRSVIVTPYLHKYGEAHALQDITIRGGLFSRVQQRDYWQFGKYVRAFAPDSSAEARAFARFVKYPYPEGVRLDSVAAHPGHISYYYSQEVPTDETSKTMLVTLQGRAPRRQQLHAAPVRYADLSRFVDALVRRYHDALQNKGHKQVRHRAGPQLHSVFGERHPCTRHPRQKHRTAR